MDARLNVPASSYDNKHTGSMDLKLKRKDSAATDLENNPKNQEELTLFQNSYDAESKNLSKASKGQRINQFFNNAANQASANNQPQSNVGDHELSRGDGNIPQASTGTMGNDFPILQYSSLQSLSNYHNVHGIGNRGHRSGSMTIEAIIEETEDNSFLIKTTTADEKTNKTLAKSKTQKIGRREIVEAKTKTPASQRK